MRIPGSVLVLLLLLASACVAKKIKKASSTRSSRKVKDETKRETRESSAYDEIAEFLSRSKFTSIEDDAEDNIRDSFRDCSTEQIVEAVKTIAGLQGTFKSLDGATHMFRNTFKERLDAT